MAIPDNFDVFLQEHKNGIGLVEEDQINFHQAMQSTNS